MINAVLVSVEGGYVDTCYNASGDLNDRERSRNQLTINGVIIADKMYARRTYGAATGDNSSVPAEIVNYDTSLYLWGLNSANVNNSGKLETVYQTELAPRV